MSIIIIDSDKITGKSNKDADYAQSNKEVRLALKRSIEVLQIEINKLRTESQKTNYTYNFIRNILYCVGYFDNSKDDFFHDIGQLYDQHYRLIKEIESSNVATKN